MLRSPVSRLPAIFILCLLILAFFSYPISAQSRITQPIDNAQRITLHGNTPSLAQALYDHGAVSPGFPADRMMLVLQRSAAQENALQQFLQDVQNSASPQYHQYLTPAQFGLQFGVSESDLQAVSAWLGSQGFTAVQIHSGHTAVEFSGTAAQVQSAFHTSIHSYVVNGEQHYANATDPEIPAALGSVVAGVTLNNFGPHALNRSLGKARLDPVTHRATPLFNQPGQGYGCLSGYCFGVTPGDFATIYDTKPLLVAGIDGTGITIGVVGIADIDTSNVQNFRHNFLPTYSSTNLPNVILDGPEPTEVSSGDELEAYLDVEEAGSVAPNATINFYLAADSYTSNGIDLAVTRAIDDNQISILSISYGNCEAELGTTYNAFYNNLYEQAAAQGITVVAAAGDSGSAACDPPPNSSGYTEASAGLAVSGLASTPYNIAVGGTDFYYPANATLATLGSYWNMPTASDPNNNADWSSAKSYIPEKPWDISTPELNQVDLEPVLGAGGGGESSCVISTGTSPVVCQSGYPKPAWQTGFGNDTVRDLPDVSLFASDEGNYSFTVVCIPDECAVPNSGPNSVSSPLVVDAIGGTSVAAPVMAGIMALVVQKAQSRQGQANAVLYPLSKRVPQAFHDIAIGTNTVQCVTGSPDCGSNGYLTGYNATIGYDLATGLGSVDAAVLANNWSAASLGATSTTLSITPTTAIHGTALSFTVNVTGGPTSGQIALLSTASGASAQGLYVTSCAAFPCTFTYAELPGGSYQVSARYAGDGSYAASTSTDVPVTISPQNSQLGIFYEVGDTVSNGGVVQVTNLNGQTLIYGGVVSFTAVPLPANLPLPANPLVLSTTPATGTITVSDNGTPVGTPLTLDAAGNASFSDFTLPPGKHSLTAAYSGDPSYNPSNSLSPLATPMNFVIPQSQSTIVLQPSAQTVVIGSSASLTADVGGYVFGTAVTLSGTVTFSVTSSAGKTTTLPAVPVTYSSLYGEELAPVTIPASVLAAGINTVSATYSGDSNYLPVSTGSSGAATILDEAANTSLSLSAAPTATVFGQTLTLTATVSKTANSTAAGNPTGMITFFDGANQLTYYNPVSPGANDTAVNSYSTSTLSVGTHTLTANYSGDAQNTPATASISVVVGAPALAFTLAATPVTFVSGANDSTANSTLTVTLNYPQSSASTFNLSCAPPANVAIVCAIPSSVTAPAAATTATANVTLSIVTATAALIPSGHQDPRGWGTVGGFTLALLLPMGFIARRKTWGSFLGALCLLALVTGLSACGSNVAVSSALPGGTYNMTVTATLGTMTSQTTIPVIVQ